VILLACAATRPREISGFTGDGVKSQQHKEVDMTLDHNAVSLVHMSILECEGNLLPQAYISQWVLEVSRVEGDNDLKVLNRLDVTGIEHILSTTNN
jgi:hypothetical protein